MIVLHASLLGDRLFLWAERPGDDATPPRLPFGAAPSEIKDALTTVGFDTPKAKPEGLSLWLPTIRKVPLASTPLIAERPASLKSAKLQPWQVTAFPVTLDEAIGLLGAASGTRLLGPGVVVGEPLAFWARAFRFAGSLVSREQFLPGIDDDVTPPRAVWEPVLSDSAAEFAALAKAMPGACRALSIHDDVAPEVAPRTALETFVRQTVDELVRRAVAPKRGSKTNAPFDSVHDRWLHALRAADSELGGEQSEQVTLTGQVRQWQRPIATASVAPFRLTFRLEEPEAKSGERWFLRYLLQNAEDPSLLLPAADAWKQGKSPLRDKGFEPREYALGTLGEASKVYPPIEKSLRKAKPDGVPLDVHQAHAFLVEHAWVLQQAGFHVLLPAWWSRKGTKQGLTLRAEAKSRKVNSGSGVSLSSLVEFNWKVALGDEDLTLAELEELARLKVPLVRLRGRWVQLSAEEIRTAIEFWKSKGEVPLRELVRMSLGRAENTGGLDFDGVTATGWVGDFLAKLQDGDKFEPIDTPDGFVGELRPYQQRGYSWLSFLRRWGLGACLADDMGLGKTIQTLALLQREWAEGDRRPSLLICPMSVVGNWQKEAERFAPELPVMVHHGQKRGKGKTFQTQANEHALVLSSYALLHRDFEMLKSVDWRAVILDEAQNIKNPETKQAKAARGLPAEHRIALTGTPVENHVGDLWSVMEFLNPGFLGTKADFRRNILVPIQSHGDPRAAEQLKRMTAPFVLRRLKTDPSIISDLPEKLEMKVYCNLTREQASLYAGVLEEGNEALEEAGSDIQRRGNVLGLLSKLKQVCNHPAQFLGDNSEIPGRSGKLARLTEMMEEILSVDDRALIFTQFTEMGDIIKRHLQETFGEEVPFLHGGVPKKRRDLMVARFQGTDDTGGPQPRIFLLSIKAGGTGLNLTAANHVIHFDRWWNPAVENQATDRAFRIGQKRNVQVHKFVCVGTLEEKIDEMIEHKKSVAEKVVGTGEAWLTEMSNAQIREVFKLRASALGE